MRKGKALLCDCWKFALTEADSGKDALKDIHWYDVELPHDWLIGDTANLYKSGCGWYKRIFTLEKQELSDCYILCFDGVYMDTTVYINGSQAGEWKYGYTSFSFDISDYVKEGENEILVRVNYKSPNSRWYSGAGIYRNVYMRRTSKTHIEEDGVYINTHCSYHVNEKNSGKWRVTIETALSNELDGSVQHTVYDPLGNPVFEAERRICAASDKTVYYTDSPLLWEQPKPAVYKLVTAIKDADENILDEVTNTFGFRMVKFDSDKGLSVNGKGVKLRGVCMHHDLGALGAACNYDATLRQLKKLKEMGVNAVRTSHNPPSREFMDICDELGLLVVSELLDMWEMPKTESDYARFFPQWHKKDVSSWIRRDRNHPSVIMWSIGNEIPDTHSSERGLEIARMLCEEVARHDPRKNAPTTIGSNYMSWENAQKVADYLKVAGYNYAEWLYKEHHQKYPDWYIYGSETASTVRSRGVYHFPADTPLLTHDDLQCSDLGNSVVSWGASPVKSYLMDRDAKFSMGQFVWTGFDYIGEPTPYSTKNSYFGIIDTAGIEKDAFWFYKSVWDKYDKKPFIHISPYWDFNEGQIIDVIVYSNLPVLKLRCGNDEYETVKIDIENSDILYGHWKVPFDSKKAIFVRGYYNETDDNYALEEAVFITEDPDKLDLKPDRFSMPADGRSLIFLQICARDFSGAAVPNANNRVKITVDGPARLVGLDNGDSTDYDSYKGDSKRLFSGKLTAIIMSTFEAGEIIFKAESEGLEPVEITLTATPCEIPEGVSVVTENTFPVVTTAYTNEVPIRKIAMRSTGTRQLDENNRSDKIELTVYPENATYNDIGFKICGDNGVELNNAEVTAFDGKTATVTAKGDGAFRLRAFAKNGSDIQKVISELEYTVTGLGEAVKNPYKYIAACLYDFSNTKLNAIERGSLGGFEGRTVAGYSAVDFGAAGSDRIIISVGNCGGGEPYKVDMYIGDADNGGEYVQTLEIPFNGGWDRGYPTEFELQRNIKGVNDISFVISDKCIFGGFEFVRCDRAYSLNYAGCADKVYGDDFSINENRVERIGNNVVIEFSEMDFASGATQIEICGRTPLDHCTIQVRATDKNGVQTTRIVEFPASDEYVTAKFDIDRLCGMQDISFVFLPGARFDMESFRFIG